MMKMEKMVYFFDEGKTDMKPLLGGKGANLAEMTRIGLPVPQGFTLTTAVCNKFVELGNKFPDGMMDQVETNLKKLEQISGNKFGDESDPLLVSVRSGARVSMPGMMDTVLNLGLNNNTVKGLIAKSNNPRFAYDCYRRFIQMFGNVVLGISHESFEHKLDEFKKRKGVKLDTELDANTLAEIVQAFKDVVKQETGEAFPENPKEQLKKAIHAVFNSWNNARAITYRNVNKIPHNWGTAVNVQQMAYGNFGDDSGTGVAFTRDPSTGDNVLYGEFLMNAQGEDVVAGIRTPKHISKLDKEMPEIYKQLQEIRQILEKHYTDMQDFEFTIEKGKLFMLQTRTGKRTAPSAIKIAADMVREGLIDKEEAIMRIAPAQLDQLLHRHIDPKAKVNPFAKGLPASPGSAVGKAYFTADDAAEHGKAGEKVILVSVETTPDDIHGMVESQGILTSRGGMTSHAAVVARGMGIPCVCGCEKLIVNKRNKQFTVEGRPEFIVKEGEIITVDGSTGNVMTGEVPMVDPEMSGDAIEILSWADNTRRLKVRANADTPEMATGARELGAQGIGLCRTERMFNMPERRTVVQEMILARTLEDRKKWLDQLKPLQKGDFVEIFEVMDGLPVTIRLLDLPLHEFLPNGEELMTELHGMAMEKTDTREIKKVERVLDRVRELREFNPMLGHRGCRVGITFPEIYEMQVVAIFEAATELTKKGKKVIPEIMVPLIGNINEMKILYDMIRRVANKIIKDSGVKVDYTIGTMIELPRACLIADQIAELAEFFSFGTNDLTQTTFGFSRDDAEAKFLQPYLEQRILKENTFEVLDFEGVGELVKIAVDRGRKTRNKLKIGICGETGGEPNSIGFYDKAGLDYVSCSRFRVPIARLAAAHSVIKKNRGA
jgi:pyruvate,orthophosphate dikinase